MLPNFSFLLALKTLTISVLAARVLTHQNDGMQQADIVRRLISIISLRRPVAQIRKARPRPRMSAVGTLKARARVRDVGKGRTAVPFCRATLPREEDTIQSTFTST